MQSPALQHTSDVDFCGALLFGMDIGEQGLAYEEVGLFAKMTCKDGIEVEKSQVGGEEHPVYDDQGGSARRRNKGRRRNRSMNDRWGIWGKTYSTESDRLSAKRYASDRRRGMAGAD